MRGAPSTSAITMLVSAGSYGSSVTSGRTNAPRMTARVGHQRLGQGLLARRARVREAAPGARGALGSMLGTLFAARWPRLFMASRPLPDSVFTWQGRPAGGSEPEPHVPAANGKTRDVGPVNITRS